MKTDKTAVLERITQAKNDFLKLFKLNNGIIAASCRAAGISRPTYYQWREDDPEFAEKADDVKEQQKDFCEALILKKMRDGDTTMIIFYAKTQMKDRGYSERREIEIKDDSALVNAQRFDLSTLDESQRATLLALGEKIIHGDKD